MKLAQVKSILENIKGLKVAVFGDLCLDAYWHLDSHPSEVSRETGLQGKAVKKHYYLPGAAANVAANAADLLPKEVRCAGIIGSDMFGAELLYQLKDKGIDTDDVIVEQDFDTVTFGKMFVDEAEQPRLDFGFRNEISEDKYLQLAEKLKTLLEWCDVLIFNQQVPGSIANEKFLFTAEKLLDNTDKLVLIDSRDHAGNFKKIVLKVNEIDAARLCGYEAEVNEKIDLEKLEQYAKQLYNRGKKPVFITRGNYGMIVRDDSGLHTINGLQMMKRTDPVGAGDTAAAAAALALASGATAEQAGHFANFASSVTVTKLFRTGTAAPDEILEAAEDPDYIYRPDLADSPRQAQYIEGTEIEITCPPDEINLGNIKHAVFDHDGTISTLRHGWEHVMEPVMIKAVLGDTFETAEQSVYKKVRAMCLDYIDKSTGIQTILQMKALVEMVREYGVVPEDKILDEFGYKEIYNDALMEMVNERLDKFKSGRLDINDYTVKGAVRFLHTLKNRGVRLYMASGTDRQDVINEANALGYGQLFEDRIYGAIGDVSKYSKKMVIDKIITDNNLHGSELVVFGDGPVELRECVKVGAIAVGIASDEVQRFGMNLSKRTRLIKSGAHLVAADFSEHDALTKLLFNE